SAGTTTAETKRRLSFRSNDDDHQECSITEVKPDGSERSWSFRRVYFAGRLETDPIQPKDGKQLGYDGEVDDGELRWHFRSSDFAETSHEEVIDGKWYRLEGARLFGRRRDHVEFFSGKFERVK